MTKVIDKIMSDFKLMILMIKKYDDFSTEWENMDDFSRSIYSSKDEYIEVSLRALIQSFFINEFISLDGAK